MSNKEYAPIVIFVYNRADKTRRLIDSLAKNHLASDSEVFIYADGAKSGDDLKVNEVRNYIDTIAEQGYFKNVIINRAEKNKGLSASVISGVTEVIEKYGRTIVLEDDLILSKWFLTYMNDCLDFYESDNRVFSISGYAPYFNELDSYDKDVFLIYRTHSWGWGTWKDRWDRVDWKVTDYNKFFFNPFARRKFARGGKELLVMLSTEMRGLSSSWAVRFCYSQYKNSMMTIAPKISLVTNDGLDNSGTHCKSTDIIKYGNSIIAEKSADWLVPELTPDKEIEKGYRKCLSISLMDILIADLRYLRVL